MIPDYETRAAESIPAPDPIAAATAAVDELRTAAEAGRAALQTEVRGLADRLAAIETRAARPGAAATDAPADAAGELERRAFTGFIRRGREALPDTEVRALRVADDTSGGFLAPTPFVAELLKNLVELSPIRQAARAMPISAGSIILPKRTGTPTAVWVGETETRTSTQSAYGQVEIPADEIAVYVDVSQRLLEDAAVNIEGEVALDLAEEFARLEGVAFVNGSGVKKPVGILQHTGVAYTATGNASTLGTTPADTLIDLFYAVPAYYRSRGSWLMNGKTLAAIRKLKDGTTGVYLWQPGLAAGAPDTILGRPVIEDPAMPDIGSAAEPILFGDIATAYRIVDRTSLSILRDPYTVATAGLVRFHARRRVGGSVVLAEAVRKVRCATS